MKKILYIEDEADQLELVKGRLVANGYRFFSASDGEEGLRKARQEKPDLILLDIFLPKIEGFELCRLLKQNPETKDIPVIVITGSGVEYVDAQCKNVGAAGCITKPYDIKDLLVRVKNVLSE